jgi:hypothetical protein
MARPRKADARDHQINFRFTAPEIVRIHRHAAIAGRTVTEFGRAVMLRRPRRRKRANEPIIIALPDAQLQLWHTLGARLNAIAHMMNARDDLPPSELLALLAQLRALLKKSFPTLLAADAAPISYALTPPVRHHLRKVGVNLAQIAKRFDQLGMQAPIILVRLLARIRTLMNGDQGLHAA